MGKLELRLRRFPRAVGGNKEGVPGWIFVSLLLAAATLLAAISGRSLGLVVALGVVTLVSVLAGALLRPDRKTADPLDPPR